MMICGLAGFSGLAKKEVALLSGDITSAFRFRVLLLLDVLLLTKTRFVLRAGFSAAVFFAAIFLITFFLLLS